MDGIGEELRKRVMKDRELFGHIGIAAVLGKAKDLLRQMRPAKDVVVTGDDRQLAAREQPERVEYISQASEFACFPGTGEVTGNNDVIDLLAFHSILEKASETRQVSRVESLVNMGIGKVRYSHTCFVLVLMLSS